MRGRDRAAEAREAVAAWAVAIVERGDGWVTVVASGKPSAVVRNSTALRAHRGARMVGAMWCHGAPRTLAEEIATRARALLDAGAERDGLWRRPAFAGALDAAARAAADAARALGVPLLTGDARTGEAERLMAMQMRREMGG